MKKVLVAIAVCIVSFSISNAQDFDFVPDELILLPMEELFQNPPPPTMEQVFYADGTKTTLSEVMPLIMQRKATPYMFVDSDRNYKILVVEKVKEDMEPASITYENIPENLKGLGYSFGNPGSDTVIIHTQIGPVMNLLTEEFKSIFTNVGGIDVEKYFVINVHQETNNTPRKIY